MKRSIFIVCLLILSLVARATVTTTQHNFEETAANGGIARYENSYKTGITSDGTTYTCSVGATQFATNPVGDKVCISIPQNGVVIVSPPREGLKSFTVTHNNVSGGVTMNLFVSTDEETWTQIPVGQISKNNYSITASSLSGNYYIKLVNAYTTTTTIYVRFMTYETEPCPNCFTVVTL